MSLFRSVRPSRRDVLKQSGMLTALSAATPLTAILGSGTEAAAQSTDGPATSKGISGDNLFTRIGVRPILNARGTFTIITGSSSLPQVKQAMMEASNYFVHLDELMPAVGAEIAKLTGAEAAIVTTGCEAAIALATVACVAGTDPERTQALPYKKAKSQVIIPKHSRNPYDFGVRMCGVEIVEVDSEEELHAKISDQTAMIYILSSPSTEKGPLSIQNICSIAKTKGIPVFVDAAAEEPLVPNIHFAHGATLVGYSGGKCMRGPQAAGLLLGQKDLVEAAWFNAAPHHNWGRAFKVGKEEIMGMLAAVRQWYKRDHEAEQREWRSWLGTIESKVKALPSVKTQYLEAEDLSNRSPRLAIHWDAEKLGITGTELVDRLDKGTPRILVEGGSGRRPDHMQSSISIMPYMMAPGQDRIVADAIYEILTHPGHYENPVIPQGTVAQIAGDWAVSIHYSRGTGEQHFALSQDGDKLSGTQVGENYKADLKGTMHADHVELTSNMQVSGNEIPWAFHGVVSGSSISGTVHMGEYGEATWTAVKS
ncbi:aminotransferase class V-fold PLP-dependent enzyme [Acidicapsa ligni]|uniref:aminotransferase class V-fold PLP-dependent enzyme n=1 Tax=Acidicapsa ligni TaxID=542300 RepID=UPI0021E01923|nr:aminotransferase class V-fold PLP-dependent enzyme [Acidicapsa ligni]